MDNKSNPLWYGRQDGLDRLAAPIFNETVNDTGYDRENALQNSLLAGVVAGVILSSPDGFFRVCTEWENDEECAAGDALSDIFYPDGEERENWEKGVSLGTGDWDIRVTNFGYVALSAIPHIPAAVYEVIVIYCHTGGDCGPVSEYYLRPR